MDSAAARWRGRRGAANPRAQRIASVALVERARGGDELAFARIYVGLRDRIFGVAFRVLGDRHDAEDTVQDTFLAAYRKLPGLGDCAAFEPWLVRIARNTALNRVRARAKCQPSARAHDDGADASAHLPRVLCRSGTVEASPAAVAALRAEFHALSRDVRATLVLHYVRGRSCQQIAEQLEVSLSCVKKRLYRGRRRLRAAVDLGSAPRAAGGGVRRTR